MRSTRTQQHFVVWSCAVLAWLLCVSFTEWTSGGVHGRPQLFDLGVVTVRSDVDSVEAALALGIFVPLVLLGVSIYLALGWWPAASRSPARERVSRETLKAMPRTTAREWAEQTGVTEAQIIDAISIGQMQGFEEDGVWYVVRGRPVVVSRGEKGEGALGDGR